MKIFRYILILIAVALIVFNATKLDSEQLMEGDSMVALIGILAAACVIVLIVILQVSLQIQKKKKK